MNSENAATVPSVPADLVVTKGKFADMIGVTPGRVSQYIAAGQIGPEALEGEGRNAKIRVAVAVQQLKLRRDVSQSLGNGLGTRLDALPSPPTTGNAAPERPMPPPALPPNEVGIPTAPTAPAAAPFSRTDLLDEQIKRNKLEQIARANRKAAEDEAARAGRLTDTEGARQQMSRIAVQMLTVFEGALSDFAARMASAFKVPQRDALHELRGEFRNVRAKAAALYAQAAEALPPLIEIDIDAAPATAEETSPSEASPDGD